MIVVIHNYYSVIHPYFAFVIELLFILVNVTFFFVMPFLIFFSFSISSVSTSLSSSLEFFYTLFFIWLVFCGLVVVVSIVDIFCRCCILHTKSSQLQWVFREQIMGGGWNTSLSWSFALFYGKKFWLVLVVWICFCIFACWYNCL